MRRVPPPVEPSADQPVHLLPGAATLRQARVPVRVETHRDRLLAIKRDELPWAEGGVGAPAPWRKGLHRDFERALAETKLPECPDHEAARFLDLATRQRMLDGTGLHTVPVLHRGLATGRAKMVRPEFVEKVKQSEHWQHQAMGPNQPAEGVEIWG